jgi:hypothetical protein
MPFSVNGICALLVLFAIGGTASSTFARTAETTKTWDFQGKNGTVEIVLSRFVQESGAVATGLQIYSRDGKSPRSVAEEAGFLGAVLASLPKEGISVQSLAWIQLRYNESEAIDRVASCAAGSSRWGPALRTRSIPVVYKLVTSFLNDCEAYREWDRVFAVHGLALKVAGVEEVIMERFSKTTANCPPHADCRRLIVPADAFVQMNIERIPQRDAQDPK